MWGSGPDGCPIDKRSNCDDSGARRRGDSKSDGSSPPDLLTDRKKRLEARRTMSDVMQLCLRHFYFSPGHVIQHAKFGAANAFRVGELPKGGRL
jgi:hypothetical protein